MTHHYHYAVLLEHHSHEPEHADGLSTTKASILTEQSYEDLKKRLLARHDTHSDYGTCLTVLSLTPLGTF